MCFYRYRPRNNPYVLDKSTTVPSVALPTFSGSFVPKEKGSQLVESTRLELIDPEESYKILRKICLAHSGHHSVTEHYYGDLPSLEMSTLDALITLLFLKGNVLPESPPSRGFPIERYLQSIPPEEVEVKTNGWTYLACPDAPSSRVNPNDRVIHVDCIVISIGIAFLKSREKNMRAALGIFNGYSNPENASSMAETYHCTEEMSTLVAFLVFLREFQRLLFLWDWTRFFPTEDKAKHCPLHAVCIKSDSEFLVKGVTEWLPKRKRNGWKDSKGKVVANREIWEQIDDTLIKIESSVNVQFWLVEEAMNSDARLLADARIREEKRSKSTSSVG